MNKVLFFEITVGRIFTILLQLIFLKMYTQYLSVYELGIYYVYLTISYSLNAFLLVPLDYFQQSKLYRLKENTKSIQSFLPINMHVIVMLILLTITLEFIFYFLASQYMLIILLMVVLALIIYINNLLRGFLNNYEYRRGAVYTLIAEGVLKISLFMFCVRFVNVSADILFTSTILAMLCTTIVLLILITRKKEWSFFGLDQYKALEIVKFSYPISFGAVINWIQLQGYRLILAPLGFVEMIDIYGTVANIGHTGMNAASTVYGQIYVPYIYKTHGTYVFKYLLRALGVIAIVLGVGLLFSDDIVLLLTNQKFEDYSILIGYGVVAEAGNFIIGALSIYLTIHESTKQMLKAAILGFISFVLSFGMLYLTENISVWTIGMPIVLSQVCVAMYLMFIVYNVSQKGVVSNG